MTALIVILCIVLCVFLLSQIRIGCDVEYFEEGVTIRICLGPLRFTVYPSRKKETEEKEEKPVKERKEKENQSPKEPSKPQMGGTLSQLKELLSLVAQVAGDMKRKLRIDRLTLHLTWAASNPCSAALGYGAANAAMGVFYPLLDYHFNIKESDVGIAVDFNRTEPSIYLRAVLTLTIGQAVAFGIHYGIRFFSALAKKKDTAASKHKKEAVTHE